MRTKGEQAFLASLAIIASTIGVYSDIERACRHYNITEAEYLAHPERYPLPERGVGL